MNKKQKLLVTAIILAVGFTKLSYECWLSEVRNRFPEVDPKVVRKAHRNMMKQAFAQKYSDADLDNDERMDEYFRIEVQKITGQK